MDPVFHPGELKVQTRAGVVDAAKRVGSMIYPLIAHVFVNFIHSQPMVILGSVDGHGMVWSSILCGRRGFMKVKDEQTLKIDAGPDESDPLHANLRDGSELGLLVIDLATRRRLRLNGSVTIEADGFSVRARQVYANCPKYIQARRM